MMDGMEFDLGLCKSVAKTLDTRRKALAKLSGEELSALGFELDSGKVKAAAKPKEPKSLIDGNRWTVYGDVYYWTIGECERFLAQAAGPVTVDIATDGGDASAALACYLQLRNYPHEVTTRATGMMLSAGGMIFVAGDKRLMPEEGASVWMMHELQTIYLKGAWGNKRRMSKLKHNSELDQLIQAMETVDRMTTRAIVSRTNMDEAAVTAAMESEKYFCVDDAKEAGIATGTYMPEKESGEETGAMGGDHGKDGEGKEMSAASGGGTLSSTRRFGASAITNRFALEGGPWLY